MDLIELAKRVSLAADSPEGDSKYVVISIEDYNNLIEYTSSLEAKNKKLKDKLKFALGGQKKNGRRK